MAMDCVMRGIYTFLCRDADTGEGGLAPTTTDLHADCFSRYMEHRLDVVMGEAIDRKVQIEYGGLSEMPPLANGTGTKRRRIFKINIRIGYFAGDHNDETHAVIAADDHLIQVEIARPANYPASCEGICVEGIIPLSSEVITLDTNRYILEITARVQVYG